MALIHNIYELHHHPANRPLGLKDDKINELAENMRQEGFDEAHPIIYTIADTTWPEEHKHLIGQKVIVGGHHRCEAAKRAGIKEVPTVERYRSYETTLHFLDTDNRHTGLEPLEKAVIFKKWQALGQWDRTKDEHGYNTYAKQTNTSQRLWHALDNALAFMEHIRAVDPSIPFTDFMKLPYNTLDNIKRTARQEDWLRWYHHFVRHPVPSQQVYEIIRAGFPKEEPADAKTYCCLYIASSSAPYLKIGVTSENVEDYVRAQSRDTWALTHQLQHVVTIPIGQQHAADKDMRATLKLFNVEKEFYSCPIEVAKAIVDELSAKYTVND